MDAQKVVKVTRVGVDQYDMAMPSGQGSARVAMVYLQELAKQGYRVEIDQTLHRTATEPPHYVLALRGPLAPGTMIDGIGGVGPEGLA